MSPVINRNLAPKKINRDKELAQKYIYNTTRWKALRLLKLQNNPLCEKCLEEDKVTGAVEVHHIQEFMKGSNINQIKWLGFDYNNLMSLCEKCHQKFHTH